MSTIVGFIVFMVVGAYWWLWRHRVTEKPWETEGVLENHPGMSDPLNAPARTGLVVFLAVVSSMFSLFISAYFMRKALTDWMPLTEPTLLWFNTLLLILASVCVHWAWVSAKKANHSGVKYGLLATGVLTFSFIFGQLWAWQQLNSGGYFVYSNPANAFFYLFTGLHGLHLLGGLWVWIKTTSKVWQGEDLTEIRLSVELCKTYWHYLLAVWVVLFALLLST